MNIEEYFLMKSRRFVGLISILILIEQGLKLLIDQFLFDKNYNLIGDYVQFKPYLNVKYSWINSLFDLGISRMLHIILVILVLAITFVIYQFLKTKNVEGQFIDWLFIFVFSAVFCSLIDKVFWGGSLDYIALKGLFIFDLKDFYMTISEGMLIVMAVFDYKKIRRVNEKELYRDFKKFITLKRFRLRDKNE